MSYEDNKCPCGGKKERETLICEACKTHIAENGGKFDIDHVGDTTHETWARRGMAIRIVTMARKRTARRELAMTYKF